MTCEVILDPKTMQRLGVICSRSAPRVRCSFCPQWREYKCDYPIATSKRGKVKDCNQSICAKCALSVPYVEMIDDAHATPNSHDYCPTHKNFVFPIANFKVIVVNSTFALDAEQIDRSTPLGNPNRIYRDTPWEREQCLIKYKRWLWENLKLPESAPAREMQRLASIVKERDLIIRCWCAPKACHGQIVGKALQWMIQQEKGSYAAENSMSDVCQSTRECTDGGSHSLLA